MERKKVIDVLRHVNKLLVEKKYDQLYEEIFNKEGNFGALWLNIEEYGGEITLPPEEALNNPGFMEIYDEDNDASIDFDLWIDDEESDLTLSLYVVKNDDDKYQFNIEDIHIQ